MHGDELIHDAAIYTNIFMLSGLSNLGEGHAVEFLGAEHLVHGASKATLECGRRTLSWDTFLTLVPLFWANERTRSLFKVFDIDMDGLQEYLTVK